MAQANEILIEVEVNAGESAQRLADVKAGINQLRESQKILRKEMKDLQETQIKGGKLSSENAALLADLSKQYANNAADLKQLTAEEKMYTAQLNIATQGDRKFGDSLVELSAQLAQLKGEYRGLTAAQRESAEGKEMLKNIQNLDKALKDADASMGDFQRNVGNYQSALLGLNGNVVKVANLFAGGFKNGIAAAGQSLKAFGKAIFATPMGRILTAVAAAVKVFNELREAFKRNDDASTALSAALARLQPIVTAVRTAFEWLVNGIAKFVNWTTKAATALLNLIPAYRQASEAAQQLVTEQDKIQDAQREYVENSAERNKQIAELNKKARGDEKLTAEEREKIYKQIDDLAEQNMKEQRDIARREYEVLKQKAKQNKDTSDEMKDQLASAYAAMLNAETEYLNQTTRNASRQAQARKQMTVEAEREEKERREAAKRAAEERRKNQEEAAKTEVEELRKLEDLKNSVIADEYEKQRATVNTNYDRQIEDLKKRLETEKNLTTDARQAINEQIAILEENKWKELAEIDEQAIAKANEEIERLSAEASKRAEAKSAEEAKAIREKYDQEALAIANGWQEKLNEVWDNAAAQAALEAQRTAEQYENLLNMDAATKEVLFKNEEEYKNAVLQAEAEMMQAREANHQALRNQAKEIGETMKTMTGALSDLYEAAAGDSEQYEKFKKAMAIVDATISLAQAIAAATSASTAGDPYTMAIRIATNVAAVTAQFAAVIKAIKAARIPSAGNYSEGGVVPGSSYYGDRLTAGVNSDEIILNKKETANLFEAIKEGSAAILRLGMQEAVVSGAQSQRLADLIRAGVPVNGIDYRLLAVAMRSAVESMPAPVLEYSEFVAYGRKVAMEKEKIMEY